MKDAPSPGSRITPEGELLKEIKKKDREIKEKEGEARRKAVEHGKDGLHPGAKGEG